MARFLDFLRPKDEVKPAVPPLVNPEPEGSNAAFWNGFRASWAWNFKKVDENQARKIASAYRCANILSDDIASLPFQVYRKRGREIERVHPDQNERNIAYLMEIQPNRWQVPAQFNKALALWLIFHGNAYIWTPVARYREMFILPANRVQSIRFDRQGNRWFEVTHANGETVMLPDAEVAHLMINSMDGIHGRSVLEFASDTLGKQKSAHGTSEQIMASGLNLAGIIWMNGDLSSEARAKTKTEYLRAMAGSENAGGLAIFDNKVSKFESVAMKPTDADFLGTIQATDVDIANFFGVPLYKLNQGKQSYQSNEQQQLDYLQTTLNPYLVQREQVARVRHLSLAEQADTYFKYNREALLQTDAKTRAEYKNMMIMSGQMSPNEGRQIDDMSPYLGGDRYYMPANMLEVRSAQAGAEETAREDE